MNACFLTKLGFGLTLAMLPFGAGCTQENAESPSVLATAANAEPAIAATNADSTTAAPVESTPPPPIETATSATVGSTPAPAPEAGKKLPPNIRPNSPLAEVVKLTQAGVDEGVIYTYITNSPSTFNLSSDEIIYLNDIGAPGGLATAMIQHDQALKQQWTNAANAQAAQATAPAAQPEPPASDIPPPSAPPPPDTVDVAPSPEPQPASVTYNYFNDSLTPYGTWIDVDGYGRCWQPTVVVVNRGWQPYCDNGHWVYTDCGWYWYSNYSWGWATFHYGRWFNHPRWGWCWWPDHVWAPSWVTWCYGGDYCGWAPLPPAAYFRGGAGFRYFGRSGGMGFYF